MQILRKDGSDLIVCISCSHTFWRECEQSINTYLQPRDQLTWWSLLAAWSKEEKASVGFIFQTIAGAEFALHFLDNG